MEGISCQISGAWTLTRMHGSRYLHRCAALLGYLCSPRTQAFCSEALNCEGITATLCDPLGCLCKCLYMAHPKSKTMSSHPVFLSPSESVSL